MTDAQNRQRWATDQHNKARAVFVPADTSVEKLAGLQAMAKLMADLPHMASTLAAVRAEIERLQARL